MFKLTSAACIMLAFAGSARALDTAPPAALTLESVPPPSLSQQAALPAPDATVPVPPLAESGTPKQRPVIVVRLQRAEPVIAPATENMAPQQFDGYWESRHQVRLARFTELAVRNARTHSVVPQTWLQEKRVELAPAVNVFASNDDYGLGLGWPLHY